MLAKALTVAGALLAATLTVNEAQALPIYTSGSAVISATTGATTDVTTTTLFSLSADELTTTDTGSLVGAPGLPLALSLSLNFTPPGASTFNWSDAGVGSFAASNVVFLGKFTLGNEVTMSYAVLGFYTVGGDFSNAGQVMSASETWSLTQTGGAGNSISMSGTFNAPSNVTVPEPGTLALVGSGLLAAAGAFRRKRASKS